MAYAEDFEKALQVLSTQHRVPVPELQGPHRQAETIDRAMRAKGKAIAMAANGRN